MGVVVNVVVYVSVNEVFGVAVIVIIGVVDITVIINSLCAWEVTVIGVVD